MTTPKIVKEYLKKIASKGGKKTLENKGKDHFRNAVNIRWAKVRAKKEKEVVDKSS